MKKKYRRVRPIFTYTLGSLGIIAFLFGMLAHGSTLGTTFELLGLGMFTLTIRIADKIEVKS